MSTERESTYDADVRISGMILTLGVTNLENQLCLEILTIFKTKLEHSNGLHNHNLRQIGSRVPEL